MSYASYSITYALVATSGAVFSGEEANLVRALRSVQPEVRTAVANLCYSAIEG